jgi:hypothetical protein
MPRAVEIPNLDNATPEGLIDQIFEQREIQKNAKQLEGILRQRFDTLIGDKKTCESETCVAMITTTSQDRLNTEMIRAEMTPEWIQKYSKVTPMTTLKITAKKPTTVG